MNISKVREQSILVPASKFPYATFPFDDFNPIQSRVFEFYEQPANAVISAATASGKTVIAEQYISHQARKLGGKSIYLSPLRALSQEKIDDWLQPNHHFHDLKLSICTGDYRLTASRRQEMEEADIILMTSEMLDSKSRNYKSENNNWLLNTKTLVIDEAHLVGAEGRGPSTEAGIMRFTEINPDCRLVLLSATMPNVNEISEWISKITNRDTILLESDYRPCKLNIHYEKYQHHWNYDTTERNKVAHALSIIRRHPKDKFLVFVHTKKTGEMMCQSLSGLGINYEYHNADRDRTARIDIENRFRNDPDLKILVATSTLAAGINAPARRVIVMGMHRGLSIVETCDANQMAGRAGRPKYDKEGDAYILLPENKFGEFLGRLQKPEPIRSRMAEQNTLAFHIVSEIHHGNIKTIPDIHKWFSRSLASHQNKSLDRAAVEAVVKALVKCGAIREDAGVFDITATGMISSLFYYSPFDVSDLTKNWAKTFEQEKQDSDHWIAMALANTNTHGGGILSAAEKQEVEKFVQVIKNHSLDRKIAGGTLKDGVVKAAYCYYMLLKGGNSVVMAGYLRTLQNDFERVVEVLGTIDSMLLKQGKKDFFYDLNLRIKYGIGSELVDLCKLPGIGKVKATRLWDAGLRSLKDVADNANKVVMILRTSKENADKLCEVASKIK